jgi:hypothetical protein
MLTEKDYCDYDTCVALKELGYPLTSKEVRYENKAVFVPGVLLYSAQKWLREAKKIEVNATYDNVVELHWHWYMKSLTNCNQDISIINYDSYEQALLAGIKEAVKILKEELNEET